MVAVGNFENEILVRAGGSSGRGRWRGRGSRAVGGDQHTADFMSTGTVRERLGGEGYGTARRARVWGVGGWGFAGGKVAGRVRGSDLARRPAAAPRVQRTRIPRGITSYSIPHRDGTRTLPFRTEVRTTVVHGLSASGLTQAPANTTVS